MYLIFINSSLIISSLIILKKDYRNFFWGAVLIGNFLMLFANVFYRVLGKIHSSSAQLGNFFVYLSFIIFISGLIVVGIFLIRNSSILQKREGRSLIGKASFFFGINLLILIGLFFVTSTSVLNTHSWFKLTLSFVFILDSTLILFFSIYLLYSFFYQVILLRKDVDYIIVLGSGICSEDVSPLLKSRIDKALEVYHVQKEKPKFIVSGGQGADEPVSEAYAMKKYLISEKIPAKQIIMEDTSTTTFENMIFSKSKILEDCVQNEKATEPVIIVSTNNYHVFRSALFAKKAGMKADGIGAPTAFYFLPSALLREFIAVIYMYKWWFIIIILLELLLFVSSISY